VQIQIPFGVAMNPKSGITVEIGTLLNQCFVIMPFDGLFRSQYERVIRPAVEASGLTCVRGDEIFTKPQIMADIWETIRKSRVVLAELSGKNANVFYELGLAHAIGKPSIIVTRNEADVPFDLRALRYLYYDTNDPFWGESLSRAITEMLRSILTEETFGSGLEGIQMSSTLAIPETPKKPIKTKWPKAIHNISGTWETNWTSVTTAEVVVDHSAVVNIVQNDSQITGSMTISAPYGGDIVVVIEMLIGSISGSNVSLQAVSYSFIRRGIAETYVLDNFTLKVADENTLKGIVIAGHRKIPIGVILKRLQEDGTSNKSLQPTR